jgi:hypothetical protein
MSNAISKMKEVLVGLCLGEGKSREEIGIGYGLHWLGTLLFDQKSIKFFFCK